jgi:hypothetical protein
LIKQGDKICERSQDTFKAVRNTFPEAKTEEAPDVEYSEELVKISTRAVNEFRTLVPPQRKKDTFDRYVASQEEVEELDRKALEAAEAENTSSYLLARHARDEGQLQRHQIAGEIGFKVCSASET